MSNQKPIKWSNIILIILLVVVILIPLFMSPAGKVVDSWTKTADMEEMMESLEKLEKLEKLESLDRLEELDNMSEMLEELDSFMNDFEMPEMDSFVFVVPPMPVSEGGKKSKMITISRHNGNIGSWALPEIVGGYDTILEHLVYPEKLKEAGIEGTVIVQVHVEKDGSVSKALTIKSSEYDLFNQSAVEAAMKISFKPIIRDGETVDAWVALPVIFKLK